MASKRNPIEERKVAKDRVKKLFSQAEDRFHEDSRLSDRYVNLARKIAMKYKVRMPPSYQKRFCKHCYKYLVPGTNCRVRTRDSKVVYTCSNCNKFMRFPFVKERKSKRK